MYICFVIKFNNLGLFYNGHSFRWHFDYSIIRSSHATLRIVYYTKFRCFLLND